MVVLNESVILPLVVPACSAKILCQMSGALVERLGRRALYTPYYVRNHFVLETSMLKPKVPLMQDVTENS